MMCLCTGSHMSISGSRLRCCGKTSTSCECISDHGHVVSVSATKWAWDAVRAAGLLKTMWPRCRSWAVDN